MYKTFINIFIVSVTMLFKAYLNFDVQLWYIHKTFMYTYLNNAITYFERGIAFRHFHDNTFLLNAKPCKIQCLKARVRQNAFSKLLMSIVSDTRYVLLTYLYFTEYLLK